jgi:beta-lactamase regulating signal transducer with metallopeptidase domain
MTVPFDWIPCLRLVGILACEIGLVAMLAAAAQRWTKSALWHRALWQAAVLAQLIVIVLNLSGLAGELGNRALALAHRQTAIASTPLVSQEPASINLQRLRLTPEFRSLVYERLTASRLPSPVEPYLQGPTLPWPELAWSIGIIAALGPVWLAQLYFWWTQRRQRVAVDQSLLRRVEAIAVRLGLHRRVRVLVSDRLPGPVAFGWLRPGICVPQHFAGQCSVEQQEVMLAHELAHLAAHDPVWQTLADVTAALVWWHPLAWWTRTRLRAAAETAADEASLLVADGPGVLAECLLQLASRLTSRPASGPIGIAGQGLRSGLARRIQRLISLKGATWRPVGKVRAGALRVLGPTALAATTTLCAAWISPQSTWKGENMKTIAQTWRRSLATLALFTAFGAQPGDSPITTVGAQDSPAPAQTTPTEPTATPAAADTQQVTPAMVNAVIQDAKLLIEMGKLDAAEAKLQSVLKTYPDNKKAARYLNQIKQMRAANPTPAGQPGAAANPFKPTEIPESEVNEPAAVSAARTKPKMDPRLMARYGLTPAADPAATSPAQAPEQDAAPEAAPPDPSLNRYRMDPRLMQRYGLSQRLQPVAGTTNHVSRGKQLVEAKLNQILWPEVLYDRLPLSEVVRDLNDYSRKRDPDKRGINFLISNVPEAPLPTGGIDPTTGLPLTTTAPVTDMANEIIKLHLHDIRLKDVLDAMVKVSEQPIRYSVEDYGVIFSPGSAAGSYIPANRTEPPHLLVRTFHVDTNTFVEGLESAFGIRLQPGNDLADNARWKDDYLAGARRLTQAQAELKRLEELGASAAVSREVVDKARADVETAKAKVESLRNASPIQAASPRDIQQALRQLLQQLGINMDVPNKAVFYNGLTGIVMVRATAEDLELVQAAIETLGGRALRPGMTAEPQQSASAAGPHTVSAVR